MLKYTPSRLATALILFAASFMVSCKKDMSLSSRLAGAAISPYASVGEEPITAAGEGASAPAASLLNVNFNNRPDGAYSLTQATEDFKNVLGWEPTRMSISTGRMKTTLLANTVGPAGGLVSWIDVPDASSYELNYDMMFDNQFDFSAGGKVGFGFLLGEGYTGGVPGTNGNGGSARIMWYKSWNGRVYLKPYLYYMDQTWQYGDDFGKTFPATGNIQKGTWYNVKMYVKSNNGSNTDGRFRLVINGTTVMDQPIRWTTNDLKRLINRVCFETFRGGADATWQSTTNGSIYFDNVTLTAI
ncbi:MAG TPA: hypothetical protein VF145_04655 [Chitinophagaceae bacterium]